MSIEKLKRVLWRLRERNPGIIHPTNLELQRAIILEIGTDIRTYKKNRQILIKLGWIKFYSTKHITLTDKDLTEG